MGHALDDDDDDDSPRNAIDTLTYDHDDNSLIFIIDFHMATQCWSFRMRVFDSQQIVGY